MTTVKRVQGAGGAAATPTPDSARQIARIRARREAKYPSGLRQALRDVDWLLAHTETLQEQIARLHDDNHRLRQALEQAKHDPAERLPGVESSACEGG